MKSISSRLDGAVSTVLIEASEPVAYLTSQPDPLTVLVDLRNVNAAALDGKPIADLLAPVKGVGVEHATAPDGSPVARVRVRLDRAATHRVRSARNTILVEFTGTASATGATRATNAKPAMPAVLTAPAVAKAPEKAAAPAAEKRAAATQLRSVRYAKVDNGYAITLAGNGPLAASKVEEAKDLPARVVLDFHDVAAGTAPAITNIKNDDIDRVRVATNSRDPLITRVVIDLARKLPYTVEQIGDDLRVLFKNVVASATARRECDRCRQCAASCDRATEVRDEKPVVVDETACAGRAGCRGTCRAPLHRRIRARCTGCTRCTCRSGCARDARA